MKKIFFVFLVLMSFVSFSEEKKKDVFDSIFERKLEEEKLMEQKKNPDFIIKVAEEAYKNKDYKKASENYLTAYTMRPQNMKLKMNHYKAEAMDFIDRFKIAFYIVGFIMFFSFVFKIISVYNAGAENRLEKGKDADLIKIKDEFLKGNYENTVKITRSILDKPYSFTIPDKYFINATLAKAYYKMGVYTNAKKYAMNGIRMKTISPELHDLLCEIFIKTNDTSPMAIKEYEIKLQKNPSDTKIINMLFDYYVARKDINDSAMNIYNKIYRYNPENLDAADMICLRGIRKQDLDPAMIPIYEKVLEKLRPDDNKLKSTLLKCYVSNKKHEQAYKFAKDFLSMKEFMEDKNLHKIFFDSAKATGKMDNLNEFYTELRKKYPESVFLENMFDEHEKRKEGLDIENRMIKDKNSIMEQGIKICPVCAHINTSEQKFCEKCGKPLNI